MKNIFTKQSFEDIANKRSQVLNLAENIHSGEMNLSPKAINKLGEHAFAIAHHKYTYPAQAEHMMVTLAAATQDPDIIKGAHRTIDNVFDHQSDAIKDELHSSADHTVAFARSHSLGRAGMLAIEQTHLERTGQSLETTLEHMMLKEAKKNQADFNRSAAEYNPLDETVSQQEAYNLLESAIATLHRAPDKYREEIAAQEIIEVAEIVAAQVLPTTKQDEIAIDESAIQQAGDHRSPQIIDALIVADAAREIEENIDAAEIDTQAIETLHQAADAIMQELPSRDQKICERVFHIAAESEQSPIAVAKKLEGDLVSSAA